MHPIKQKYNFDTNQRTMHSTKLISIAQIQLRLFCFWLNPLFWDRQTYILHNIHDINKGTLTFTSFYSKSYHVNLLQQTRSKQTHAHCQFITRLKCKHIHTIKFLDEHEIQYKNRNKFKVPNLIESISISALRPYQQKN